MEYKDRWIPPVSGNVYLIRAKLENGEPVLMTPRHATYIEESKREDGSTIWLFREEGQEPYWVDPVDVWRYDYEFIRLIDRMNRVGG